MSNIKQHSALPSSRQKFATIHPFKIIDVGLKKIMINMGKFYELGQNNGEVDIGGDLGDKMVDHIWKKHDPEKAVEVASGDSIYLKITFQDPDDVDRGKIAKVASVNMEKGKVPNTVAGEKILVIAKIKKQEQIGNSWVTEVEQLWKTDAVNIFIGDKEPDGGGGGGGDYTNKETFELDVMTGITCRTIEKDCPQESSSECCYVIGLNMVNIKTCGELVGSSFDGDTIECCGKN